MRSQITQSSSSTSSINLRRPRQPWKKPTGNCQPHASAKVWKGTRNLNAYKSLNSQLCHKTPSNPIDRSCLRWLPRWPSFWPWHCAWYGGLQQGDSQYSRPCRRRGPSTHCCYPVHYDRRRNASKQEECHIVVGGHSCDCIGRNCACCLSRIVYDNFVLARLVMDRSTAALVFYQINGQ